MQKIRIMTDSASDLPADLAGPLGITVLPIPIIYKRDVYREGIDFTNERFYELLLTGGEIPTTSHITEEAYYQEYLKAYEEGCTHLLNITLNSLGSGIYQAACLARNRFYEEHQEAGEFRIEVVDSRAYSMAYGIAAVRAAEMARDHVDFDGILDFLNDWFGRLEIILAVYSLKFARKSGRIGCAAGFLGEKLGMRPMIAFIDGTPRIVGRVRGDRRVTEKLIQTLEERMEAPEGYPFLLIRGTPVQQAAELEALLRKREPELNRDGTFLVGPSVAINCGPEILALIYAGKNRRERRPVRSELPSNVRVMQKEGV